MRIRIDAGDLADALGWLLSAVPKFSGTPILAGVLLVAEDDGLLAEVTGDHSSLRARLDVGVIVDEPGKAVVPARVLAAVMASLKGEATLTSKGSGLHLQCGRAKYEFPLMPTEEYPRSTFEATKRGTVLAREFHDALKMVSHAIATNEVGVPVLESIHLEASTGSPLVMVTTDRYRLARAEIPWTGEALDVVPDGRHLLDIAKGLLGTVTISYSEGYLLIGDPSRTALMRMHAGQFPMVDALLPKTSAYDVSVATDDLLEALKRISAVFDKEEPIVVLDFDPAGVCSIRTDQAHDSRQSGVEVIDCTASEPINLAFKSPYLADALRAHGSERVQFHAKTKERKSPVAVAGNKRLTAVIMQIRTIGERAN